MATNYAQKIKTQTAAASKELAPTYAAKIAMLKSTLNANNSALNTQKASVDKNFSTEVASQNTNNITAQNNYSNTIATRGLGANSNASAGIAEMNQVNNKYVGAINQRRTQAIDNINSNLKLQQSAYDNNANTMANDKQTVINNLARNYADKEVAQEYQAGRDATTDSHWKSNYDHTASRDNISDAHFNTEQATSNARYKTKVAQDAQAVLTDNARYDAASKIAAQKVLTNNQRYADKAKIALAKITNSADGKAGIASINNILNGTGTFANKNHQDRINSLVNYEKQLSDTLNDSDSSQADIDIANYLLGLVNNAKLTLNGQLKAGHEDVKAMGGDVTTGINPLTGKAQINMPYTTNVTGSKAEIAAQVAKGKASNESDATIKAQLPMLNSQELSDTSPKTDPAKLDYLNGYLQPKNQVPYVSTTPRPSVANNQNSNNATNEPTDGSGNTAYKKMLADPANAIHYRDDNTSLSADQTTMNAAIDKISNPITRTFQRAIQNVGLILDVPDRTKFGNEALDVGRSTYQPTVIKKTGNGVEDFVANLIGSIGSLGNLASAGVAFGGAESALTGAIEKNTGKVAGQYVANKVADKALQYGVSAGATGTEFAGLNAVQTALQGGTLKQDVENAGKGFVSGALWGVAGKAFGEGLNGLANTKTSQKVRNYLSSVKTDLKSSSLKSQGFKEAVPNSGYWVKSDNTTTNPTKASEQGKHSVFVQDSGYVDAKGDVIPKWQLQITNELGEAKTTKDVTDIVNKYKKGLANMPAPKEYVNPDIKSADTNIQELNIQDARFTNAPKDTISNSNIKNDSSGLNEKSNLATNPEFDINKTINVKGMGDLKVVSKQKGKISLKDENGSIINMSEDDLNQLSSKGKYVQPNDEVVQSKHDEIDQAQGLAEIANKLENMPQENPVMEATRKKVIQINRNNAQRVLDKAQKGSDIVEQNGSNEGLNSIDDIYKMKHPNDTALRGYNDTNANPTSDTAQTVDNVNANAPMDSNIQQNANNGGLNHISDTTKKADTADNNGISDSKEMKSIKLNSINVDPNDIISQTDRKDQITKFEQIKIPVNKIDESKKVIPDIPRQKLETEKFIKKMDEKNIKYQLYLNEDGVIHIKGKSPQGNPINLTVFANGQGATGILGKEGKPVTRVEKNKTPEQKIKKESGIVKAEDDTVSPKPIKSKSDMTSTANMSEKPLKFTKIKPGDSNKPPLPPKKPPYVKPGDPNWDPSLEHEVTSEYVDNKSIPIDIGKNDKVTSQNIRDAFTGKENGQIVAGQHLSDTMKKLAPNEQEGIQLFIDAGGNMSHLKDMATHDDPIMDSYIPNTKITYRDSYKQALNLSPDAMKAAKMAEKYYKESGDYALKTGATNAIRENYANRMWVKPPKGVKTDIRNNGINPNTSHGKQRVYDNISEGLLNGKQPATLKANDLLAIHNQEMSHANTTRELATSLETSGLGSYSKNIPEGFKNVVGLDKHVPTATGYEVRPFVLPENLANGLRAITDSDLTKKIDSMRGIQKYQGVVKTMDLAFSTFHHITLAAQALYNNKGGIDFIRHWNKLHLLDSPEFQISEKDFARHTGTTSKLSSNIDTLNKLTTTGSKMDKITNLPILKQGKQLIEANNNLLFGKIQRWLKVTDYQNKVLDFVSKHPETVNADLSKAKISIAKEVNLAYGGLNWESLGKNPSALGIERMVFLAPDWTESSVRMIGKAFEKGPGGKAARSQYVVGLVAGSLLTEGLNYLFTGHLTDKNPKGHELQLQVQPDVYISLFRSGIGDFTKLVSNVVTNGFLGGVSKSLQGKLSPFLRTGVGLASNTDYLGRKISNPDKTGLENDINILKYVLSGAGPIPFGVPSTFKYNNETPSSGAQKVIGNAFVASGAGTYAKGAATSSYDGSSKSYAGNWLRKFTAPGTEKEQIDLTDQISAYTKSKNAQSKTLNEEIGTALKNDPNADTTAIYDKYNTPRKERRSRTKAAIKKLDESNKSDLQQKYDGLSKIDRKTFYNSLSSDDQQLINTSGGGSSLPMLK